MTTQFGASSSSTSSTPQSWGYDVFVSFRGEDTRNTFTGHLHHNLVQKGIYTFLDDGLKRGEEISPALQRGIEDSKISIVVFSKNYASSKWCLEELVKILQCKESKQQMVYPVFYKVDPSDVRNQNGSFSLGHHDNLEKMVRWKTALTEAGNLSGWHFSDGGHEANFIGTIVEEISAKLLMSTNFVVAKYPVGIESRVEDVLKLLHVGENDVRMVGIWGIGGIGKTTIAKAVYNSIVHRFEGSCFLENVKEPRGGLVQVQNLFLSKILGEKELHINNVDLGVNVIKKRLGNKRVLIILDDVNELEQLNKLVGNSDWFGSGSRIIITTRDKRQLTAHDIDQVYEVKELSYHESLELFKLSAFKEKKHMDDYAELLENVILYAQGVPLVLEVLGSDLRGRHVDQWKVVLGSYAKEPNQEIQNKLKISYDALQDSMKEIFLHIACFFKGNDKNYVIDILEACDLNPERGIEVLKEKALIKITQADSIQMHDLLEEMGKEIVRQESPHEPGERSRLWRYEDVCHIFVKNSGTNKVKGIMVKDYIPKKICLSSESFSKLKNLQIFMISNDIFYGDHVDTLSNELRLLDWEYCPLQSFPSNFIPTKLVLLNMPSSQTSPLGDISKILFGRKMPWSCKSPWDKGQKNIQTLKSIDLSYCLALRKIPDFSRFPNLVDLNVRGCENLIEVDPSIGLLKKLVNLDLSLCSKLGQFEIVDEMKSLKYLNLGETAIEELSSSSIGCLINLEKLSLSGCDNLIDVPCNILELQHLQHLDLAWCKNLVTFPTKSEFSTNTTMLYDPLFVNLSCCKNLIEISEFPREINSLHVSYCSALKRISKLSNILEGKESKMTPRMKLNGCDQLCANLAHDYVAKMKCRFKSLPDDSLVTALLSLFLSSCRQSELKVSFASRSRVPEWFTCRTDFESFSSYMDDGLHVYNFSIEIPGNFKWENKGLAFCAQREKTSEIVIPTFKFFGIYINGVCITEKSKTLGSLPWLLRGYVWLHYIPFDTIIRRLSEAGLPPPSTCQVQYVFRYETFDIYFGHVVEGSCGIHVVMPEDDGVFVNGSSNPFTSQSQTEFSTGAILALSLALSLHGWRLKKATLGAKYGFDPTIGVALGKNASNTSSKWGSDYSDLIRMTLIMRGAAAGRLAEAYLAQHNCHRNMMIIKL